MKRKYDETNLKLKADEHGQEDKAKAENTDRKANQPSEHPPPPGWVIKLLTARHRTTPLHALGEKMTDTERGQRDILWSGALSWNKVLANLHGPVKRITVRGKAVVRCYSVIRNL